MPLSPRAWWREYWRVFAVVLTFAAVGFTAGWSLADAGGITPDSGPSGTPGFGRIPASVERPIEATAAPTRETPRGQPRRTARPLPPAPLTPTSTPAPVRSSSAIPTAPTPTGSRAPQSPPSSPAVSPRPEMTADLPAPTTAPPG